MKELYFFLLFCFFLISCEAEQNFENKLATIDGEEKIDEVYYHTDFDVDFYFSQSSKSEDFFYPRFMVNLSFIRLSYNDKTAWCLSWLDCSLFSPVNLSKNFGYFPVETKFYYCNSELFMEIELGVAFMQSPLEPKGFYSRNNNFSYVEIQNELTKKDTVIFNDGGFKYEVEKSHIAYTRKLLIKNSGTNMVFSWIGDYNMYFFNSDNHTKEKLNLFIEETSTLKSNVILDKDRYHYPVTQETQYEYE